MSESEPPKLSAESDTLRALQVELARLQAENLRQRTELEILRHETAPETQGRVEEALRIGEERFRVALQAAEMGAWDYDVAANEVIWNEQHFRLLGLPVGNLRRDPEDFLQAVHPGDQARIREELRRAVEETGAYRADFRILRADTGKMRWMSGFGQAIEYAHGRARRLTGVMIDVTEREQAAARIAAAEESLRLLVDSALEHAIISLGTDRKISRWNPGAQAIFGYTAQEAQGQSADIIFTPEDQAAKIPDQEMQGAMEKGRASDNRWMQRKDGSRFWANGAMLPMRDPGTGALLGFVKILRDETEMHEAREALEDGREQLMKALRENELARAEVEAASAAKDQFLAMLSHELRTPLTPVLMGTHFLERIPHLPDSARETIKMMRRNLRIEVQFIDDLLDVTRIGSGKFEIVREPVDLHETIRRAVEVTENEIRTKEIQLSISLEARQHLLAGDPARLQQAVWNLLKNAAKFTPARGRIRVHSWNENDTLRISIADTGMGIEAEALDKIFNAFTQAGDDITRKFGGLGLGLAITKAAVEAHGGSIQASSEGSGKGATFTIMLPLPPAGK